MLHEIALPADSDKKKALASLKDLFKGFGDVKLTASQVYGAGDYVVVIGTFEGTNTGPMPDLGIKKKTDKPVSAASSRSSASRTARSRRTGSSTTDARSRRSSACRSRVRRQADETALPTRERAAFLLRDQASYCAAMGSPLYAHLLERAAADAAAGGPMFELLEPFDAPNLRADALALRLMAAVHRLVLTGEAPRLAAHYPTAGGTQTQDGAWDAFVEVVAGRGERLRQLVAMPCQTNEVGRCAPLAFGFLELAARYGLPLRLLEVGASAGLNLRFDHFRYGGGGAAWGPAESPVDLTGMWLEPPARLPGRLSVVERRGCDRRPVDVTTAEGRLQLESSLWADQVQRLARLRGAFAVAARGSRRAWSRPRWTSGCRACWPSRGAARRRSSTTRSCTSTSRTRCGVRSTTPWTARAPRPRPKHRSPGCASRRPRPRAATRRRSRPGRAPRSASSPRPARTART